MPERLERLSSLIPQSDLPPYSGRSLQQVFSCERPASGSNRSSAAAGLSCRDDGGRRGLELNRLSARNLELAPIRFPLRHYDPDRLHIGSPKPRRNDARANGARESYLSAPMTDSADQ
jgi:hypothetical protein